MKRRKVYLNQIVLVLLLTLVFGLSGAAAQMSELELNIWKDPEFQRRFTESYIAETEIEPRITVNEREKMQKILELISDEKLEEAIALLEKNRGEAATAVYDFTLANIYFQEEKLEEAAGLYQIAVEKYPKFKRAWNNLALIHIRLNQFEEAIPAMTRVVELGGGTSLNYGLLGYAYASVENYISAESAYRMAILLDPHTLDWKMGLVRSLFRQRSYSQVIALCQNLIEEYPDKQDFWLLQANAYIGLKQPLQAAQNYELVDEMGKSTADSLNMLGDIYINEELYDLAVNAYLRALQMDSGGDPKRALQAAKILAARAAYPETKRLIREMESDDGARLSEEQRKDILKLQARIAVAEGAEGEEAEILEQIVALDPLDGDALILLGQRSSRLGDNEKAIFYFERAAGLERYEADAKLRHGQLLVKTGKYSEALPLLKRAQTLKPRDDVRKYIEQVERIAKGS